jgi:hypothetical protein
MNIPRLLWLTLLSTSLLLASPPAHGGSGTWIINPVDSSWNTAANWSSNTVPGGLDTATFKFSEVTDISISGNSGAQTLLLDLDASAYSFTALPGAVLDVGDGGITNLSGLEQNFIAQTDSAGQAGEFVVDGFGGVFGDEMVFTEYGAKLPPRPRSAAPSATCPTAGS